MPAGWTLQDPRHRGQRPCPDGPFGSAHPARPSVASEDRPGEGGSLCARHPCPRSGDLPGQLRLRPGLGGVSDRPGNQAGRGGRGGAASRGSPWEGDPDPGSLAWIAVDLGPAAQALRPFPQVAEPLSGAGGVGGVEAAAVVVDLQDPAVSFLVQRHPAGGRLSVAADVGEGLAGQLDHVGGPAGQLGGRLRVDLGDGQHAGALAELLDEVLQRLVELAVGQDAGPQPEDVVAQVADDPVQLLHGVLEAAAELGVAGQQGRALQAHADREQGLDGPVVQLLGDPLAVLEHGQALQLPLEAGVLQGHGGLLGESLYQLHGRLAQGRATAGVGNGQRAQDAAPHGQGTSRAGPAPAATIGWATRGSAEASARTTALPVRMTSPVTDPSAAKTAPRSRSAPSPSPASTASRSSSTGRARVARSVPARARACRTISSSSSPVSVPARMAVLMTRMASRRWARSVACSYRLAASMAAPAWAASRIRARSSSASKSARSCFSLRYRLP